MTRRTLFAATLTLFVTVPAAFAADSEGTFDKSLSVSGQPTVSVSTGAGYIHVNPGADNQFHIIGHVHANPSASSADTDTRIKQIVANPPIVQTGNTITIGKHDDNDLYRNIIIDYDVTTPRSTALAANSGSGSVQITGIAGTVSAQTGSGAINLSLANSTDVKAQTGSGSIHIDGFAGGLRAQTGSGSIEATGNLTADWRLQTGSGSIHLKVAPTAHFNLDASTGSGEIHGDQPITMQGTLNHHHVTGTVNGGGPALRASTGSGSITINGSAASQRTPRPELPPRPWRHRLRRQPQPSRLPHELALPAQPVCPGIRVPQARQASSPILGLVRTPPPTFHSAASSRRIRPANPLHHRAPIRLRRPQIRLVVAQPGDHHQFPTTNFRNPPRHLHRKQPIPVAMHHAHRHLDRPHRRNRIPYLRRKPHQTPGHSRRPHRLAKGSERLAQEKSRRRRSQAPNPASRNPAPQRKPQHEYRPLRPHSPPQLRIGRREIRVAVLHADRPLAPPIPRVVEDHRPHPTLRKKRLHRAPMPHRLANPMAQQHHRRRILPSHKHRRQPPLPARKEKVLRPPRLRQSPSHARNRVAQHQTPAHQHDPQRSNP